MVKLILLFLSVFNFQSHGTDYTGSESLFTDKTYDQNLISDNVQYFYNKSKVYREINIDPKYLREFYEHRIKLNDDSEVLLSVKKVIEIDETRFIWVGKVEGDHLGSAVITVGKYDSIYITLFAFGKHYRLYPVLGERFIFQMIEFEENDSHHDMSDQLKVTNIPNLSLKTDSEIKGELGLQSAATDGSVIDLMVVYTEDASNNTTDIVSQIENEVAWTNEALERSCAQTSFRLVHTQQITYTESGNAQTDLTCLQDSSDGCLDNVHTLRSTYGADLVQMWTATGTSGLCGLAYAPVTPSASYGFSWKLQGCGAATMAHELGHNLGNSHDPYEEDIAQNEFGDYLEGYGHINLNHGFRTIMSYSTECTDHGVSCPRISYFSNPNVMYNGVSLGVANREDVANKIAVNRVDVANYVSHASTPDTVSFGGCAEIKATEQLFQDQCFIATASMGSRNSKELMVLRTFRDHVLLNYQWGKSFVQFYYAIGPKIVPLIQTHQWFKTIIQWGVSVLVWFIHYVLYCLMGGGFLIFLVVCWRLLRAKKV